MFYLLLFLDIFVSSLWAMVYRIRLSTLKVEHGEWGSLCRQKLMGDQFKKWNLHCSKRQATNWDNFYHNRFPICMTINITFRKRYNIYLSITIALFRYGQCTTYIVYRLWMVAGLPNYSSVGIWDVGVVPIWICHLSSAL